MMMWCILNMSPYFPSSEKKCPDICCGAIGSFELWDSVVFDSPRSPNAGSKARHVRDSAVREALRQLVQPENMQNYNMWKSQCNINIFIYSQMIFVSVFHCISIFNINCNKQPIIKLRKKHMFCLFNVFLFVYPPNPVFEAVQCLRVLLPILCVLKHWACLQKHWFIRLSSLFNGSNKCTTNMIRPIHPQSPCLIASSITLLETWLHQYFPDVEIYRFTSMIIQSSRKIVLTLVTSTAYCRSSHPSMPICLKQSQAKRVKRPQWSLKKNGHPQPNVKYNSLNK